MKWLLRNVSEVFSRKNKSKKNKTRNNSEFFKSRNISMIYFYLLIFSLIPLSYNLPLSRKESSLTLFQSHSNEIIITVKGTGLQNIITPQI